MQRGRGRGRGRNPNPARGTSRRDSSRSRSRNTNTPRARSRASIRRSARIAEILNNELQNANFSTPTASFMADVARTRGVGSTQVRSRHHTSGNGDRRSRSNRHTASPEDIRYAMDIVVQPPTSARAGCAINGTLIVRLRTTNMYADDATEDSYNLFALASLVPHSTSVVSDPRALDRSLGGRRYVSVHSFSDDEADGSIAAMELDDPQGVGYMNFPDLSIHQTGTFRIRITLIRVPQSGTPSIAGGESIQAIESNPIVVQGAGPTPRSYEVDGNDENNNDDGGWSEVLRTIETRRRSR